MFSGVPPIGVMVGLASGYLSGWVDLAFQRITDIGIALEQAKGVIASVPAAAGSSYW